MLPLGWLFYLISAHSKEDKCDRDKMYTRLRQIEQEKKDIEVKVVAMEQKYITDTQVRSIIKAEFEPIREEYKALKEMLSKLNDNLIKLDKEIVRLNAEKTE